MVAKRWILVGILLLQLAGRAGAQGPQNGSLPAVHHAFVSKITADITVAATEQVANGAGFHDPYVSDTATLLSVSRDRVRIVRVHAQNDGGSATIRTEVSVPFWTSQLGSGGSDVSAVIMARLADIITNRMVGEMVGILRDHVAVATKYGTADKEILSGGFRIEKVSNVVEQLTAGAAPTPAPSSASSRQATVTTATAVAGE